MFAPKLIAIAITAFTLAAEAGAYLARPMPMVVTKR